jgi:hypothetical protein
LPTLQLVQGESVSPKTQEVYIVRIRSVLSHSTQALIEGALISLLVVGLMAGTAFASKPTSSGSGGHKGGGGGSAGTATLVVSPNPVATNSDFRVSGCGYKPSAGVQLNLYAPGTTSVWAVTADSAGCLPLGYGWAPGTAGTATLKALEGSVTVVASTTFQIN